MSMVTWSRRKAAALFLVLFAALALAGSLGGRAEAEDPAPTPIASAPALSWGFKASWRNYAPAPQTADGAQVVPSTLAAYDLEWDFESGSYDPVTRTTQLSYSGTVHWQKYKASQMGRTKPPTYTGPETDPYLLDLELSDPQITISADSAVLTAVATSRNQHTWELTDYGRVPIADLDVLGVTPTVAGGTTKWEGIPGAMPAAAVPVFDSSYRVGMALDPVGFSYSGDGGAPDFSEHWDTPGTAVLKLVQNALFVDGDEPVAVSALWLDRENLIVHTRQSVEVEGVTYARIAAFGLEEMKELGHVLLPNTPALSILAYDTVENRILYRLGAEAGMRRWMRFNATSDEYETGVFADPKMSEGAFTGETAFSLAWDPTRDRGYRIQRIVPAGAGATEYDKHEWTLITYKEGEDGIWVKKTFKLPSFPSGQNQTGYPAYGSLGATPTYATASDGSLIVAASTRTGVPATTKIPAGFRITFDAGDENAIVEPLPLEVNNAAGAEGVFNIVQAAANGHVVLARAGGDLVHLRIDEGGTVHADPPVSIKDNVESPPFQEQRFALDPDGTIWFAGIGTQKLGAFKGSKFLGAQFFKERNPRGGPVLVGDDHFVYAQTNDGVDPGTVLGTESWGFGKFERLGFVPAVTAQPQPDAVALAVGEDSEVASFSSAADGDPAPQRQWQVKAPGSSRFADLAGETGPTLDVAATRSDDGAEYRAVYSNAAGKVATEAALLSVEYAPVVLQSPANATVTEGEEAEFAVLADGKPEPAVTWQRRVGGFWENVGEEDESIVVEGNSLTVLGTDPDQSGAQFRARLANSLGTVASEPAKLTVTPRVQIPPGGVEVAKATLAWTGSAELQKAPPFGGSNYFSAGVSRGDAASFQGRAGDAVAFQVGAGGTEAISTWATRASHVGSGGSQLIRLYRGSGRVEEDGSATLSWSGSFSVNFYGGLAPFTVSDPVLEVGADGDGVLSADLAGCASSMANPSVCTPLATAPAVTVATFSGVEVDPAGELTVIPDYAGVEVEVPSGTPAQNRSAPGWGAWPQPFVDYHVQTGLAPYWYSSGGIADPDKPPAPFTVDLSGGDPPALPPAGGGGDVPRPAPPAPPAPVPPSLSAAKGIQAVGPKRRAKVATLRCPGLSPCRVRAPRNAPVRIGGRTYWADVFAPGTIPAGASATVRARLAPGALAALGDGRATLRVRLQVRSDEGLARLLARVPLEAAG